MTSWIIPPLPPTDDADARGPAAYFDGATSKRHDVTIEAAADGLRIVQSDQSVLDEWAYADLRTRSAPDGLLRLGRSRETSLARLEVRDAKLAAAIERRAPALDRGGEAERRLRLRVVGFSLAAIVSLILTATFGMPVLANRIAPAIPVSVESRFGAAVDKQVRQILDSSHRGAAFQCGGGGGAHGLVALDKLVRRLEKAAKVPYRLHVDVVHRKEANAFALPGGHIYVFEGLIDKAETPDELAGVLAHEIGHVARRDGTRAVIEAAGLSFLFGLMLGDFVGGGGVIIAAKTALSSSYSRQAEAAADAYSVALMKEIDGDPRALGAILSRIAADKDLGVALLRDHPETKDRIAAISAATVSDVPTRALLSAAEWSDVKRICAARQGGRSANQPKP